MEESEHAVSAQPRAEGKALLKSIPRGFILWVRRAVYGVAALLGLWLLTWLAAPPLVKWQGEKVASEQLGRKVSIGTVEFKPWSLELALQDVAVDGPGGGAPQLTVKRMYANAEIESIWRLAPVLDAIHIEEPVLKFVHQGGGRYDFDDIVARLAEPPAEPDTGKPTRFAFYNIQLDGGAIDFDDQAVGQKHEVRALRLTLPFISNLPSQREIKVQPHLAFVANGSSFDSRAQALPFDETRQTDASLKLAGLNLEPYLGYVPDGLPIKLHAATVDAEIRLGFEQAPEPSLRLSGHFEVSGLKSVDQSGAEALAFDALKVELADVRPLERKVHLAYVELRGPRLGVRRDSQGRINLLMSEASAGASKPVAKREAGSKPEAAQLKKNTFQVSVDKLAVHGGAIEMTDQMPATDEVSAASLRLGQFELAAATIAYPFAQPLSFKGSAVLEGTEGLTPALPGLASVGRARSGVKRPDASAPAKAPSLEFEGTATDQVAEVKASVSRLPLALAAPYLSQTLKPRLTGALDAQLGVQWAAARAADLPQEIKITSERMALSDLMLTGGSQSTRQAAGDAGSRRNRGNDGPLASIRQIELTDARVDLRTRAASVGRLSVMEPKLDVARDERKRWMYESWLHQSPESSAASAPQAPSPGSAGAELPWKAVISEIAVSGGTVGWRDFAMARPVRADLTQLKLDVRQVDLGAGKPIPVVLSAQLGTGRADPGRLSWQGTVGFEPLAVQGSVDALRLPVHAFEPYFGDALNIDILRADASFKGQVAYGDTRQGPRAKLSGDVLVEELRTHSRPDSATDANAPEPEAAATTVRRSGTTTTTAAAPASQALLAPTTRTAGGLGEELLSWKLLKLDGLEVVLEPGRPTQVEVKDTLLSDFYARLIIHPSGRINMQDILKSAEGEATAPAATAASSVSAPVNGLPARGEFSASSVDSGASAAPAPAVPAAVADPNAPVIRFGPIKLASGKVLFSDRFIRPNYSADLSELNGSLSAFSSVAPASGPELADLQLTGRAEGSAILEVSGKLNPLAKPLALDIKGKVRDLELPPLTPYSVKYAGHGIERGKLSVDVTYLVLPDGRLTATNKLVLNQLEFSEPVPGAPASLPVRLATALLADSHGVIDLDFPISGSLNDPQFSLGPIIFKAVVNLIGRAITAPFTLLARALGGGSGGDDLAHVAFAPGSAALSSEARSRLDKVAKALKDRPALKVTVIGTADLKTEREGWLRGRLSELVAAEKRSAGQGNQAGGAAVPAVTASSGPQATVSVAEPGTSELKPEEYQVLLRRVYRRADLPGKPRNVVGMSKDIPVAEMESLLMAHIDVNEDAMRQLAVQRGVAVKDYLASQQLPAERLFLGAARTGKAATDAPAAPAEGGSEAGKQATWSPRAELNLSAK